MDPKIAAFYGSFVEAAYAMYFSEPTSLTPDPKAMIPAGYRLISWIQMTDFGLDEVAPVFYGFIARSPADPRAFVLALRGTEGVMEWWDNAHFGLIPFPTMPGYGYVSNGFATIYGTLEVVDRTAPGAVPAARDALAPAPSGSFAQQVARSISRAAPAPEAGKGVDAPLPADASLTVTAHSLGAALLTLFVLENETNVSIRKPDVYTFASPRVGDQTFADKYNALGLNSWRISNDPDLVPNVPPDIFGYVHVDTLYQVDSTGKVQSTLGCAHAMATYRSLLDPALSPDHECLPDESDSTVLTLRAQLRQ